MQTKCEVVDLDWRVNEYGEHVPWAILQPNLKLGYQPKTSLRSYAHLVELGIGIGAEVMYDTVLFQIVKVLKKSETYKIPTRCAHCGDTIKLNEATGQYYCNDQCCGALALRIYTFWKTFNLPYARTLDEAEQFAISCPHFALYDPFHFSLSDWFYTGLKPRQAERLVKALEAVKTYADMEMYIRALRIPNLYAQEARAIARAYDGDWFTFITDCEFDKFKDKYIPELIEDARNARQSVIDFINRRKTEVLILAPYVLSNLPYAWDEDDVMTHTFTFIGGQDRELLRAEDLLRDLGAEVTSRLKRADIVVSVGGRITKAQQEVLNNSQALIISRESFFKHMRNIMEDIGF